MLVDAVACALSVVFGIAAVTKLCDLTRFRTLVDSLGVIPAPLCPMIAGAVPILELIGAVTVVSPSRIAAAIIFGTLLTAFTAVNVMVMFKRVDAPCGCFGSGSAQLGGGTLARNLVLMSLVVVLADGASGPTDISLPGWIAGAALTLTFALSPYVFAPLETRGLMPSSAGEIVE